MDRARLFGRLWVGRHDNARGTPRHLSHAGVRLQDRWTTLDGVDVFYREAPGPPGAPVMIHLHGFALSGQYLLPTAERLAGQYRTLVPDLPGSGRSGDPAQPPDIPRLAAATKDFLDDLQVERATLVGNSLGCAVVCEFARLYPGRLDRAILVSPAGGGYNRPLQRAMAQLARAGTAEPLRLLRVAVPDYLRFGVPSTLSLFRALEDFPSVPRMLAVPVPTLVVLGTRDPLLPPPARVKEVAAQSPNHVDLVVIVGAAHAINFSHPGELANVIRQFMTDQPIEDDPHSPGHAHAVEIYRGAHLPTR